MPAVSKTSSTPKNSSQQATEAARLGLGSHRRGTPVSDDDSDLGETPRRRLSAETRREEILTAARELFAEHGYHATTTRQLAQAAGVSDALLYRHFTDKAELLTGVIDRALSVFSTQPPLNHLSDLPLDGLLTALGHGFLQRVQENLDLIVILIGNQLGRDDPRFAAFIDRAARGLGEDLARRQPGLSEDDGYLTARTFFGSLMAFVMLQRLLGMDQINNVDTESYLGYIVTTTVRTISEAA